MPSKEIIFCGRARLLSCDGKCSEAWGINWRGEKVAPAPDDTGTYEGGHGKEPLSLNKWCARECERSEMTDL